VSKIKAISRTFNLLSGRTGRYNRTLRIIKEWSAKVQALLETYELYEGSDFKKLLKNTGEAKFDLTAIAYNGRPLVARAVKIKDKEILKSIADLVDEVESIRRYLMNPSIQVERLGQGIHNLRSSFELLQNALSKTEYM